MKGWIKFGLVSASLVGLVWGCVAYTNNKEQKEMEQSKIDKMTAPYFCIDHFGLVHLDVRCWGINETPTVFDLENCSNTTIELNSVAQFNVNSVRYISKDETDSLYKYFCENKTFCRQCCPPEYIEGVKSIYRLNEDDHEDRTAPLKEKDFDTIVGIHFGELD